MWHDWLASSSFLSRNRRKRSEKTMINQLLHRQTSHRLCGEPPEAPESKEKSTSTNSTSSKRIQHNRGYGRPETTGRHSNCIASMRLDEWLCMQNTWHRSHMNRALWVYRATSRHLTGILWVLIYPGKRSLKKISLRFPPVDVHHSCCRLLFSHPLAA